MYLSKTDFREYLQCNKSLWLRKNEPDLYIPPADLKFEEKLIEEGFEVEFAARELFDKGTLLEGSLQETSEETKKLIQSKSSPIFQATFITDSGMFAKTDVITYNEFAAGIY